MGSEAASKAAPAEHAEPICPACRRPLTDFPDLAPVSGSVRKCPVHDLALIDPHEFLGDENDAPLGRTIAGRFVVLGRLGKGSMGAVYRARQRAVGRDVALKIVRRDRALQHETKARFEREARAVSLLTSPHTITAFDFGEAEDGSWFLAMEMLEGETLGERLRRERRLSTDAALQIAKDALCSLAEAHAKGIIHRDLKPDNIFLSRSDGAAGRREIAKLLDFGIAKWEHKRESFVDPLETLAGTVFGTPRYMSPEQAQGLTLDARSDLYSLGVLLFHMLTGRPPFTDDDAVVVMARHIQDDPPWCRDAAPDCHVPVAIEAAVRRAMSKSPASRPQSADEMRALLEAAQAAAVPDASLADASISRRMRAVLPKLVQARSDESSRRIGPAALRAWLPWVAALALLAVTGWVWALRRHPNLSAPAADTTKTVTDTPKPKRAQRPTPSPSSARSTAAEPIGKTLARESSAEVAVPASPMRAPSKLRSNKTRASSTASSALPRKANERYGRFE